MIDQPAPILTADETNRRNAERRADRARDGGTPTVVVGDLGRIARRPMTASEAAAAFLWAAARP